MICPHSTSPLYHCLQGSGHQSAVVSQFVSLDEAGLVIFWVTSQQTTTSGGSSSGSSGSSGSSSGGGADNTVRSNLYKY